MLSSTAMGRLSKLSKPYDAKLQRFYMAGGHHFLFSNVDALLRIFDTARTDEHIDPSDFQVANLLLSAPEPVQTKR